MFRKLGRHRNDGQHSRRARTDRRRQDGRESPVSQSRDLSRPRSCSTAFRALCTNCWWCRRPASPMCRSSATASMAAIPIRGHLLCIIDLAKRTHVGDIDLRPYIAPHTLQARARRADLHHLREQRGGGGDRPDDPQGGRCHRLRIDQRPSPDHFAGRPAALYRKRRGRHGLGDRSAATANSWARSRRRARSPASRYRPTAAPSSRSTTKSRRCS